MLTIIKSRGKIVKSTINQPCKTWNEPSLSQWGKNSKLSSEQKRKTKPISGTSIWKVLTHPSPKSLPASASHPCWLHIHFSCYNDHVIGLQLGAISWEGLGYLEIFAWLFFVVLYTDSPWYESCLCHLLVVWPWISYLTSVKHLSEVLENDDYMR